MVGKPRRPLSGLFRVRVWKGRSPVRFVSAKNTNRKNRGNAFAHHISRRAQAYAGPARELDWQRCVGLFLEGFSLLCELHGAQVSEGRVEPLVVVPPYVPVGVRAQLLHARVRVGVYELLLMRRLVDSTTALS